jgi:predicted secreted Zn-dependent protease
MKTTFYCLLGILACAATAEAEPRSQFGASFYYIEGGSALVLLAQMDKKGPVGLDGRNHPARTKWEVQWRFRHNMHGSVCKMEKISVTVGLTSIKPRWRDEAQGPSSLRERWKKLIEAVDRNEAFHKQQALDAGSEIEKVLNGLAPKKNCEALTDEANQAAKEVLGVHQSASRDYDLRTNYGRKNGVSLI